MNNLAPLVVVVVVGGGGVHSQLLTLVLWEASCYDKVRLLLEDGYRGLWNCFKDVYETNTKDDATTSIGLLQEGELYLPTTVFMVSTQVSSSFWSEVWNKHSARSQVLTCKLQNIRMKTTKPKIFPI